MQEPRPLSEEESSNSGCSWLATVGAICLLVVVIGFGLCAGFCGGNCLKR